MKGHADSKDIEVQVHYADTEEQANEKATSLRTQEFAVEVIPDKWTDLWLVIARKEDGNAVS